MYAGVPSCRAAGASRPAAGRARAAGSAPPRRPLGPPAPAVLASPQSTTSVSPKRPSMMLPGFRSRCSTPRGARSRSRCRRRRTAAAAAQLQRPHARVAPRPLVGVEGGDRLLEAVALDEPHGVVGPAVGVAAQAVDRDDARVLQPAGDLRLAQEAGAASRGRRRARPGSPSGRPRGSAPRRGRRRPRPGPPWRAAAGCGSGPRRRCGRPPRGRTWRRGRPVASRAAETTDRLACSSASATCSRSRRTGPSELRAARLRSGSPPCCPRCSRTSASSRSRRASPRAPCATRMRSRGRALSRTQALTAAISASRVMKSSCRARTPKSRLRSASLPGPGPRGRSSAGGVGPPVAEGLVDQAVVPREPARYSPAVGRSPPLRR